MNMTKRSYQLCCPNCSRNFNITSIELEAPKKMPTWCFYCYYPLNFYPIEKRVEIAINEITKNAFLIHSSEAGEKELLDWFIALLRLYGVQTHIIETDPRPVDWLQKSLDGILAADFAIALLTKRYQFLGESGEIKGWKAPDKCYDEIAISFALQKPICVLVEKDVDSGNVLNTRAWCYKFTKNADIEPPAPIKADIDFFQQLFLLIEQRP